MEFLAAVFFFNIHIVFARDGWCEVEEDLAFHW